MKEMKKGYPLEWIPQESAHFGKAPVDPRKKMKIFTEGIAYMENYMYLCHTEKPKRLRVMEKKTIITDVTTGKTVFSDYTLEEIEELIAMDKDIQAELDADAPDQKEQDGKSPTAIDEVLDAFEKYPKVKEFLSGSDGEVPAERVAGLVKLASDVENPIDETVRAFDMAIGTPFILPFCVLLETCCREVAAKK